MKEALISLRTIGKYPFSEQMGLFRNGRVRLPEGVVARYSGSGICCTYVPELDESVMHTIPIIGRVVECIRSKQFPAPFQDSDDGS